MTVLLRQIRTLITEAPLRQKKQHEPAPTTKKVENRRKSLTVKISKEPPAIVYFNKDKLEDSFECIFDPQVHHDKEEDHPDLVDKFRKRGAGAVELKPWMKPPYCDSPKATFMTRFKSAFS